VRFFIRKKEKNKASPPVKIPTEMAWIGVASHGRDPGFRPKVSQPIFSMLMVETVFFLE